MNEVDWLVCKVPAALQIIILIYLFFYQAIITHLTY